VPCPFQAARFTGRLHGDRDPSYMPLCRPGHRRVSAGSGTEAQSYICRFCRALWQGDSGE
jgi:hypothetical protein